MFVAIVSMNDTFLISKKVLLISKTQITQVYREYTRGDHSLNHYNKSDFFQGSKPLKKVLKNLEKNYFKSPIDP